MEIEKVLTNFVLIVFGCIAIAFIYKVIRYKGFKAALFGAPIRRTVGELELSRSGFTSTILRVHVLGGDASKEVGLELVSKSPLSYHMAPFTLSRGDAGALARLLEDASAIRGAR